MPRSRDTVYANMSFNAHDAQVQAAIEQAQANSTTLGTYLKKLVLAVLGQGPVLLLTFREMSRVRARLLQEACDLEMPLDAYVLALLADRDRSLYDAGKRPAMLWYPRGQFAGAVLLSGEEEAQVEPEDDVNIEEAIANATDFLSEMSDF